MTLTKLKYEEKNEGGNLRTDETEIAELPLWILNLPAPRQKENKVHKIQCTQVLAGPTVYNRAVDKPRQN